MADDIGVTLGNGDGMPIAGAIALAPGTNGGDGGAGEIDHSLFEGSSSEDDEDKDAGGSVAGAPSRSPRHPTTATEVDCDLFENDDDSDGKAVHSDGQAVAGAVSVLSVPKPFAALEASALTAAPARKRKRGLEIGGGIPAKGNMISRADMEGGAAAAPAQGVPPSSRDGHSPPGSVAEKPAPDQKRRVPRKVGRSMSTSAAAVLAEARERMRLSASGSIPRKMPASCGSAGTAVAFSAVVPRRGSASSSSKPSSLSAGGGTAAGPSMRPQFYPKVEVDQFWRSVRNWDFIPSLNMYVSRSSQNAKADEEESGGMNARPLPEQFESVAQYKSMWAPLLLREARSQTLSEVSASWSDGSSGLGDCSFVKVQRLGGEDSDVRSECITIKAREIRGGMVAGWGGRGGGPGGSDAFVSQNETLLLVRDSSILEAAVRGKLVDTSLKWGLLGTAAARNRGVDGLTVRVSRRRWESYGAPEMYLYRMGSNVTALREFSALCRADSIPLSRYLLAGTASPPPLRGNSSSEPPLPPSSDPLSERGGSNALPPGFRIYVKAKFNPSQLRAISAAAREYGSGGFTLVKGPPGTGKTTTLVALLNALHLRQYQRYYSEVERITTDRTSSHSYEDLAAIHAAAKVKPRILVCAPSNAAVDNVIAKVIQVEFVDGVGKRYKPSIVRVGTGQSTSVWKVSLQAKRDSILAFGNDPTKLEVIIAESRNRLKRYQNEIQKLQRRVRALSNALPYALSSDWEIRIDEETFDLSGKVIFICHKTKTATYDPPPPPHPHETLVATKDMPHYRNNVDNLVRYIEKHNEVSSQLEQYVLVQNTYATMTKRNYNQEMAQLHSMLETNILDSEHIVCTTLGSAGSKTMASSAKFEVVVVDEAAQCSEPAALVGLQLGSSHALLVGDPQQLPATIFSLSGRSTKYDRSLFQRLEEAGNEVHMLDTQYRMDPAISSFPRRIFYDNCLLDGPNVRQPTFGGKLSEAVFQRLPFFKHFTMLDLDSAEERGGTSLSNAVEAQLVLHLYSTLDKETVGIPPDTSVAIITPYSQQVGLLRRLFSQTFGEGYSSKVEISTVDAFQGREACMVIFSCVRAAHKSVGIGFLSDVQRMNVALTRAKHFLFVIARCRTIVVNPYWRDLVGHARKQGAIITVPFGTGGKRNETAKLPDLGSLSPLHPGETNRIRGDDGFESEGEFSA